ncbi:GNAT family N-acetyltransferase [Massilia sp. ZL223]|uniref:GNAT family N-acetyltransferase n=1 Tax=Massilia sp. ZL223 TaxID=2824904 RepID=UPI001B823682|nr:GNAT family N-acetyltransferase [Massilia sp. ZL223]MBQ5964732.1 GNAT family N-acetyltransferase [Massilia sp. ZL223]
MVVIHTPRLALRTWRSADAEAFHAMNQDPRVIEHLPGPMSMQQVADFMAMQNALYERSGSCYLAATLAAGGALIGFVGLKRHAGGLPFAPCTDIGWRLGADYWGNSYAREAAAACLHHGFERLGLDEIVSFTVPQNLRSRALMERLGMRRDEAGDFAHPALPAGHRLSGHVLYRLRRGEFAPA